MHESSLPEDSADISRAELEVMRQAIEEQLLKPLIAISQDRAGASSFDEGRWRRSFDLICNAISTTSLHFLSKPIESLLDEDLSFLQEPLRVTLQTRLSLVAELLAEPSPENARKYIASLGLSKAVKAKMQGMIIDRLSTIKIDDEHPTPAPVKYEYTDLNLPALENLDPDILEPMLDELPSQSRRLASFLQSFQESKLQAALYEARRIAHSLKGDANALGVMPLAALAHRLEDALELAIHKGGGEISPHFSLINDVSDAIGSISDYLTGIGDPPAGLQDIFERLDELPQSANGVATSIGPDSQCTYQCVLPVDQPDLSAPKNKKTLQVELDSLDAIQGIQGEVVTLSRQVRERLKILESMRRDQAERLKELSTSLTHLNSIDRQTEFSAMSFGRRNLSESRDLEIDDFETETSILNHSIENARDADEYNSRFRLAISEIGELLSDQELLQEEMQGHLQATRRIPFWRISGRLQRIVRQAATQTEKSITLRITGEEQLIESVALDGLIEPLGHMLRNAVDHGIEAADQRLRAGKSAQGEINVLVFDDGDLLRVSVQDDGAGLDLKKIANRAVKLGLIENPQEMTPEAISRLILHPSLSTKAETSSLSGRGIGMEIVQHRLATLGGNISISTKPNKGTRIELSMPSQQGLANVVLIGRGEHRLAAMASSISQVIRIEAEKIKQRKGQLYFRHDSTDYEVIPSYTTIHVGGTEHAHSLEYGLVVRTVDGSMKIFATESIQRSFRAVIRPFAAKLPPLPHLRGVTILDDGSLTPVVDLTNLLMNIGQSGKLGNSQRRTRGLSVRKILVADDSLSMRRTLSRIVSEAGAQALVARDGAEALKLIEVAHPVLALIDLEMPQIDGLELARYIRKRPNTKDTPIVMITSKASRISSSAAKDSGIDMIISKPFKDHEIHSLICSFLEQNGLTD